MQSFEEFYQSDNELNIIKQYRQQGKRATFKWLIAMYLDEDDIDVHIKELERLSSGIRQLALKKFIQFNEYEYMLHLLDQYNYGDNHKQIKSYVISELKNTITWLKELLYSVAERRMMADLDMSVFEKGSMKDIDKELDNSKKWITELEPEEDTSVYYNTAYKELTNAKSLKENIIAVTRVLNICHDGGKLLHVDDLGPFNDKDFDTINNIKHKKVEHNLKQLASGY